MPRTWQCAQCRAMSDWNSIACEGCAAPRPRGARGKRGGSAAEAEAPDKPRMCPYDGAALRADGFCPTGEGYPAGAVACPDVCPHCRAALDWSGGCSRCHGCTSGAREDWTFPGHRYEVAALCPTCRKEPPLAWVGEGNTHCPTCGSGAPLYNLGHYRRDPTLAPGRPALPRSDNVEGAQVLRAVLAKMGAKPKEGAAT